MSKQRKERRAMKRAGMFGGEAKLTANDIFMLNKILQIWLRSYVNEFRKIDMDYGDRQYQKADRNYSQMSKDQISDLADKFARIEKHLRDGTYEAKPEPQIVEAELVS